jgi:hypothetical protein
MSREAMQIALDALEANLGNWAAKTKAVEVLRQALETDLARVGEVGVWGECEWVGLTDEEIYEYADKYLYQHGSNYGIKAFGKAIEAKLKEKNKW